MGTVNTVLTQAALETVLGHPIVDTRLSQAVLEVILPSGLTPPSATPVTRLTQAALEVIVPRGPAYLPNHTLVYDTVSRRWQSDTRAFAAFYDEGSAGNLLAGSGSALLQLESGPVDFDQYGFSRAIPLHYLGGFQNMELPENPKLCADLVLDVCTNGVPLTVALLFNDDSTTATPVGSVFTYTGARRQQFVFALGPDLLGLEGRSVALQLQGDAPLVAGVTIFAAGIHYYVEPRDAQTWDTGWSDWGSPLVKQIDLLEFEIKAPDGVQLQLYSNLQSPKTWDMPAKATHTIVEVPISKFGIDALAPDYFEGRLLRLAATTNPNTVGADDSFKKPFRLYSARARYREIGAYCDGSNGEEWLTFTDALGELALVKMARIIELDCETTGSTSVKIYTDLPHNAMELRQTRTWNAASRRIQRFRLAGSTKGHNWQFQVLPAAILRLYGMRIYAKAMASGEDWHWYVIPIPVTSVLSAWKEFPIAV